MCGNRQAVAGARLSFSAAVSGGIDAGLGVKA